MSIKKYAYQELNKKVNDFKYYDIDYILARYNAYIVEDLKEYERQFRHNLTMAYSREDNEDIEALESIIEVIEDIIGYLYDLPNIRALENKALNDFYTRDK